MKKFLLLAGLLSLGLALPGAAKAAPEFEYNFQSMYSGPHILNLKVYDPRTAEMEQKSNGRLRIHYFMSGALTKPEDAIPAVMNGNLDIGGLGSYHSDKLLPHSLGFQQPHISPDSRHASALFWKAYNDVPEVKAELDKVGKILTVWGSDRSGLFSAAGPIHKIGDVKGKRVLIWSGNQVDQVKAWGGVPVQVSPNDTYMALQRGMGDVFYGPLPTGVAYKIMEVAKNITIIPASTLFLFNAVNWDVWNEMPKDIQDIIWDAWGGEKASIEAGQLLYDSVNKDLETMKAAGCTIYSLTPEEYQTFKDADGPVLTDFWMKEFARLGVKDPAGWIKLVRDMSAAVPVQN